MNKNNELIVFDQIKQTDEQIGEFWSARDLQKEFGYDKWENFERVIKRAKKSFNTSGLNVSSNISDHFLEVGKMVELGSGATREVDDFRLSRYACYLIAQNGDPSKRPIALAQAYFALQTRRQELKDLDARLEAREKYRISDKNLSTIIEERDVSRTELATIKSNGDKVLFGGNDTRKMKKKLGQKPNKPLVDVLPTISITAKQLANEMTHINTVQKDLRGFRPIDCEHQDNNHTIRKGLTSRSIYPEHLPPEPDIRKLSRKNHSTSCINPPDVIQ